MTEIPHETRSPAPVSPEQAREALAGLNAAQVRLARAQDCPPWRHAAFGVLEALFVLFATAPVPFNIGGMLVGFGLVAWLVRDDRRRTGLFANGFRRGATLPLAIGLLLVLLGLLAWSASALGQPFPAPVPLIASALAFLVSTLASVAWQRIYVAELERGVSA